jgi:SAM-dependent methyltransferase
MAVPHYLQPYLSAAERFGGGFGSLLWASPHTQKARFDAIVRLCDMNDRIVMDAGCGRADLLDLLLQHGIRPKKYIGLEAVDALADAAEAKGHAMARIVRGDFVREPLLFTGDAQVTVFSGSLNTLHGDEFESTLQSAWQATRQELVFNFLCSPLLAAGRHLTWHPIAHVRNIAQQLTRDFRFLDDYLEGDCSALLRKVQ